MTYIGILPNMILWWYSQGLKECLDFCFAILVFLKNTFSVSLNLKTLFAPWRRTTKPLEPNLVGLKNFVFDQIVARGLGFLIRTVSLIAYLLITVITLPVLLLAMVIWIVLPLIGVAFLIAWVKHCLEWI
jgi:hypothetical protein